MPDAAATLPEMSEVSGDPLERITSPHPIVQEPVTPPDLAELSVTFADQAMNRMSEAAHLIEEVEPGNRRLPRASRLSPIRDISGDIRRESTPMPAMRSKEQSEDLGQRLPDLWPWIQELEADEGSNDIWANRTDPLISRHVPTSAEAALIEAEDIRRARAAGITTAPIPIPPAPSTRLRVAFAALAILAILALVIDVGLLSVAFIHPHAGTNAQSGPPALTLVPNVASYGQMVTVHINHFFPSTRVLLSHDIQEPVQVANTDGTSLLQVSANGSVAVPIMIDNTWGPGFHMVQAEDVTTRYTVSATLQIIGAGPTRPSHLVLDGPGTIDMGTNYQGTNTIQAFSLHNSGGGSITWQGSSNQPWLLLSPPQGIFSTSQTISVAVERANLKPGDYTGKIVFFSNIGSPESVEIQMTVRPLPANAGPVLEVTPAALSFLATDGGVDPASQLLTVTNPGTKPLYWSLNTSTSLTQANQNSYSHTPGATTNWLTADQQSGLITPGTTQTLRVYVYSHNLLPGVYTGTFVFTAQHNTLDSPQDAVVSLTIQPRCGLLASTGSMSFVMVAGQSNPSNQALNLAASSSCTGAINWQAIATVNWLTVTPANGQLRGTANAVTAIGVNAVGLRPGVYSGTIALLTGHNTETVTVRLIVQMRPPPNAPIMAATPLSLNFSATQGQANPPGQVVTITNTGGGTLYWHSAVTALVSSWLSISPTGGSIRAGDTGQMTVNIHIAGLTSNTYIGQITLFGTDSRGQNAGGNPQTLAVNLQVMPPCTIGQLSSSALAFSGVQGGTNPAPQTLTITPSGNCGWPLTWKVAPTGSAPWLTLSPGAGSQTNNGQPVSIIVNSNMAGLAVGTYSAQVTFTALDSSHMAVPGSPQTFSVTLTVLSPCTLQVTTSSLTFSTVQGQSAPPGQGIAFSDTGACAYPVSVAATADSGSSAWLALTSGSDSGSGGSVSVNVNPTGLQPGTYTGQITLSATASGGGSVQNGTQAVPVKLVVTGFTISGTVIACSDTACTTSAPLPGATLTLTSGSVQIASTTADSSGNYSFSNIALGAYTLVVSGTDSGNIHYTASPSLTVAGNQSFSVNVFPG